MMSHSIQIYPCPRANVPAVKTQIIPSIAVPLVPEAADLSISAGTKSPGALFSTP